MDYDNTSKIFIFIDESGDTGDPRVHSASSKAFTINLAVATDEGVTSLETFSAGFKFFNFYKKELKTLSGKNLKRFAENFKYLTDVMFYEITIDKDKYVGPYWRDGRYPRNDKFFRSFILRVALEHVAASEHLLSFQKPIELVIDRYMDSKKAEDNLISYLKSKSYHINLPNFVHIVQVDSRYCLPIQVLDVLQKMKKRNYFEHDFCKIIPVPASLLQNEKSPDVPTGPELFS